MSKNEVTIRSPLPGEYGWIIEVHGRYYAETFGWREEFEGIVAKIIVDYLNALTSEKQCCYIAEDNDQPVGCIMLMEKTPDEGKVRVMFVSESARGKGVGTLLIDALINKARAIGYQTLSLWTTNNQTEARKLYQKVGFSLVAQSPNTTFTKGSFDEEWKMDI